MVNEVVVRIISERIMNGGENPLRKRPFKLDDVVNQSYRKAVEDYIIQHSSAVDINEVEEENTVESTEPKSTEQITSNNDETHENKDGEATEVKPNGNAVNNNNEEALN